MVAVRSVTFSGENMTMSLQHTKGTCTSLDYIDFYGNIYFKNILNCFVFMRLL